MSRQLTRFMSYSVDAFCQRFPDTPCYGFALNTDAGQVVIHPCFARDRELLLQAKRYPNLTVDQLLSNEQHFEKTWQVGNWWHLDVQDEAISAYWDRVADQSAEANRRLIHEAPDRELDKFLRAEREMFLDQWSLTLKRAEEEGMFSPLKKYPVFRVLVAEYHDQDFHQILDRMTRAEVQLHAAG
jgi:hypothetical protein